MTDAVVDPQKPTVTPVPQMTKAEAVAKILKQQEASFDVADREERLRVGKRLAKNGKPWNNPLYGLFEDPSIEYTLAELKALVPLDRDSLNYDWTSPDKKTVGKFAKNVHGLLSIGRQHGRRRKRMTKHQQAIKSASLRLFKSLMETRAHELQTVCKNEGIEYLGIPDAMIPEVGALAAKLGMLEVTNRQRQKSHKARRRKEFSRKVNAGTITKSASEKRYVNRGGQFGN